MSDKPVMEVMWEIGQSASCFRGELILTIQFDHTVKPTYGTYGGRDRTL